MNQEDREQRSLITVSQVIACVLLTCAILGAGIPAFLYYKHFNGPISDDSDRWAQAGEFFGGTSGAVLMLLTIIGVAFTLYFQARQLKLSRKDVQDQRAALERQNFEGTFFHLLKRFDDLTSSVLVIGAEKGRPAFKYVFKKMSSDFGYVISEAEKSVAAQEAFQKYFLENEPEFGPYFRALNALLQFIDGATPGIDKHFYARLVRAQLSKYELGLLFYNGTWGEGAALRPLVERYAMLKHLSDDALLYPEHRKDRRWYGVEAFGPSGEIPNARNYHLVGL